MKVIFILSFVCFFIFGASIAQININTNPYWDGKVVLLDGSERVGEVQVPNSKSVSQVSIKNADGKKESIPEKDIHSVYVASPKGQVYLYERLPIAITMKGDNALGKSFLLVQNKNNFATFYVMATSYKVNKKTGNIDIIAKARSSYDFPVVYYLIRKKDRDRANLFYSTGLVGGLKPGAKTHFEEAPALASRIKKGDFKPKDIQEVIRLYMEETKDL